MQTVGWKDEDWSKGVRSDHRAGVMERCCFLSGGAFGQQFSAGLWIAKLISLPWKLDTCQDRIINPEIHGTLPGGLF